ncbi:MAG: chemotaxis protein CheW, partial [bacterium]
SPKLDDSDVSPNAEAVQEATEPTQAPNAAADEYVAIKDSATPADKNEPQELDDTESSENDTANGQEAPSVSAGSSERDTASPNPPGSDQKVTAEAVSARLPEDADPDLLGEFIAESLDHISASESALLELESNPDDEDQVHTIFRAFHTIKGTSGFLGLEAIQTLAHLAENLLDRAREGEVRIVGGFADLALNSCDVLRNMLEGLEGVEPGSELALPDNYEELVKHLRDPEGAGISEEVDSGDLRLGDILVARGSVERDTVEETAKTSDGKRIGEALVENKAVSPADVAGAVRTQNKQRGKTHEGSVCVGTERLDGLIDAVGELVIAQSMVAQDPAVTSGANPQLSRNVSHAGKIVRELQDVGMSLRMVPLKATFGKLARLVRDLGRKAGKKVQLVTEGEYTEIDRNMVEALKDPLVHMMRNAVDHGLESPEQRAEAGKAPTGTIRLRAYHSAGNVVIELADDGKGLDRDRILAKARDRGLVKSEDKLSDSEVFGLIFQAGFSTAEKITDVSGRGVGMDVVKHAIESLRGRVEVDSKPGVGSTFTVRLPLTMAIADSMLIRVGEERYLLPIVSIERSFRPKPEQMSTVAKRGEMVSIRGELLPVFRLYKLFGIPSAKTSVEEAVLVIVEGEGKRYAMMVDELLGQQQVVLKSLGDSMGNIPGVSGGAILGDGRVGLILDAAAIAESAHSGQRMTDNAATAA